MSVSDRIDAIIAAYPHRRVGMERAPNEVYVTNPAFDELNRTDKAEL